MGECDGSDRVGSKNLEGKPEADLVEYTWRGLA